MLSSPPPQPSYGVNTMSDQNIGPLAKPGKQGLNYQGPLDPTHPGLSQASLSSSYAPPSSAFVPSSYNVPNPYYQQPLNQNAHMISALMGRA